MSAVLVMLASPLLGAAVRQPVTDRLSAAGWTVAAPVAVDTPPRTPHDVLQVFLSRLPDAEEMILIPHGQAHMGPPGFRGLPRTQPPWSR